MPRVSNNFPKTTFGKELSNRDAVLSQNIKYLGKNGFRFSKGLAGMVRNPEHILGKFFRRVNFLEDKEISPALKEKSRLLANVLNTGFRRFISTLKNARQEHWFITFSASIKNGKIILDASNYKKLIEEIIEEIVSPKIIDDRTILESAVEVLTRLGRIDQALSSARDDSLKCRVFATLVEEGKTEEAAATFERIEFKSQGTELSKYMRASFIFSDVTEEQARAFMEKCGLRYFIPLDIKSTDTIEADRLFTQTGEEILEDYKLKLAMAKRKFQTNDLDTAAAIFEYIFWAGPAELGQDVLEALCEIGKKDWAITLISERKDKMIQKAKSALNKKIDAAEEAARSLKLIGEKESAKQIAKDIWESMPLFRYRAASILVELGEIELGLIYARRIENDHRRKLALALIACHLAKNPTP